MKTTELKAGFQSGKYAELLKDIYIDESVLEYQKERYVKAIESFEELFGVKDVEIYSAPGRSEIGGNHTDHQCGRVLAASINLDAIAIVAKKESGIVLRFVEGRDYLLPSQVDNLFWMENIQAWMFRCLT